MTMIKDKDTEKLISSIKDIERKIYSACFHTEIGPVIVSMVLLGVVLYFTTKACSVH